MELGTIIIYFILGFALFFILNYFDQKEENNSIHAIFPIIYIIILAGIFSNIGHGYINDNLFLIIIFELLIRMYYIKSVLKREDLCNYNFYFKIYGLSIIGGYFINRIFISQVESVFPSASEMRMGIWLLIIIFLYTIFKNNVHIEITEQRSTFISRKKEYVLVQYARLKNQYYKDIKLKNKDLVHLIYAIMIYENYKRPSFYRRIDRIIYRFTGKETKMGIMQIPMRSEISDLESIKLACKKINSIEIDAKNKRNKNKELLVSYYGDDKIIDDILDIYEAIVLFDQV